MCKSVQLGRYLDIGLILGCFFQFLNMSVEDLTRIAKMVIQEKEDLASVD